MISRATSASRHVTLIAALVLLAGVPSLFTRDLWNPDEPRYMEVAREMAVLSANPELLAGLTGEQPRAAAYYLIMPHLNAEVYPEKPPLLFWLAAGLWRAGLGYNAGRVVTILCVVAALVLLYAVSRPRVGEQGAFLAALISLSTLLMFYLVRRGVLDPLLALTCTVSLLLGYRALHEQTGRRAHYWIGAYAAMALGTLTKGPVGFLVPGLVLLAYGLLDRKAIRPGGRAHLAGAAVFAAVVLAWLVPALIAGGKDYAQTILVKQQLGRVVRSYSHRNPFYYYVLLAPGFYFPWSLVLPIAFAAALRYWRRTGQGFPLFAALWLIVPIIFFSLISGKRINYVLPTVPALGLVCGWYLTAQDVGEKGRLWADRLLRVTLGMLFVFALAGIVMVALAPGLARRFELRQEVRSAFSSGFALEGAAAGLVLPAAACLLGLVRRGNLPAWRATALGVAVLLFTPTVDVALTPVANQFKSGRAFACAVNRRAGAERTVYLYRNDLSGLYNLYTGRLRMPVVEAPEDLVALLAQPRALVIADAAQVRDALTPERIRKHTILQEKVGHRSMVLLGGIARPRGRRP